ncbi:MAG TPA: GDYXXLXY domain-containing protein [Verrucomicrobiae bacterium]|jgi:uncharacterized membrane-anchored protein|nr:GDYXXLXY domain-containing protein [Verrucomicrobiae bacterium]
MRFRIFALVIALQSAWIIGTSIIQERALRVGTAILLETQPVDPRDLLAGDFIRLNYKISDVPTHFFTPPISAKPRAGSTVFVALAKRGRFYEVARASIEPLDPAIGEVVLHGLVESRPWQSPEVVHLEYGLERYYVPEGKGNPRGKVTVEAVVPSSGGAAIKEVFVDGKPFADPMK